jgi:hypothetical protein
MWKPNNKYWNTGYTHLMHKVPLHNIKAGVWCPQRARIMDPGVLIQTALFLEDVSCKRLSNLHPTVLLLGRKGSDPWRQDRGKATFWHSCQIFSLQYIYIPCMVIFFRHSQCNILINLI